MMTTYQIRRTGAPYGTGELGHLISEHYSLAIANAEATQLESRGEQCEVYLYFPDSGSVVPAVAGVNC